MWLILYYQTDTIYLPMLRQHQCRAKCKLLQRSLTWFREERVSFVGFRYLNDDGKSWSQMSPVHMRQNWPTTSIIPCVHVIEAFKWSSVLTAQCPWIVCRWPYANWITMMTSQHESNFRFTGLCQGKPPLEYYSSQRANDARCWFPSFVINWT